MPLSRPISRRLSFQQAVYSSSEPGQSLRNRPRDHRHQRYRVTYCLIASLCIFIYKIPSTSNKQYISRKRHQHEFSSRKQRIAICLPYLSLNHNNGPQFPPYFPLFLQTARGSSSLIDFLIFHTGSLDHQDEMYDIPENVKFINLQNVTHMALLLSRVVVEDQDSSTNDITTSRQLSVVSWMEQFLPLFPYLLVEYKPAYGHIFQKYLTSYSHWGYSDFDIVWGDVSRWITQEELQDFDIVTYGFGDQDRVYVRGQFTFHKNHRKINNLWRTCEYLSYLDQRISQHDTPRLESAEGCYSYAILQHHDLRVKYAVKAFSDAESQQDILTKHGLYIGLNRDGDGAVLYTARYDMNDGSTLLALPTDWFVNERISSSYADYSIPIQRDVGEREPILKVGDSNTNCMFWVRSEYQKSLCLDKSEVDRSYTLYWIDGQLYKQKYEMMSFPRNIQTAPFFHFQEWKRTFSRSSQFVSIGPKLTFLDPLDRSHGWIMLPEGLVPILPHSTHESPLQNRLDGYKRLKYTSHLPKKSYCLRWKRKQVEYTEATFCESYVSWTDSSKVHLIHGIPMKWNDVDIQNDITLALTLEITKEQANQRNTAENLLTVAANNLALWNDHPCVLLVYIADTSHWIRNLLDETFQQESYAHCLIGAIQSDDVKFSRKALRNMVYDSSPTRWTISGMDLERGLVLSREAMLFSQRATAMARNTPGSVFIIPQFNLVDPVSTAPLSSLSFQSTSLIELLRLHQQNSSSINTNVMNADCMRCPGIQMDEEQHAMYKGWWELSLSQIISSSNFNYSADKATHVQDPGISNYFAELMRLLTTKNLPKLQEFDHSPILLMDALGPRDGMLTSLLVQEVDEFAGSRCMNALKLAQMIVLHYNVQVLPGAFALTSDRCKSFLCPVYHDHSIQSPNQCPGCFMFENHHDLFHVVAREEAVRPAKTSLLWAERNAILSK